MNHSPERPKWIQQALRLEWMMVIYNVLEALFSIGCGILAASIALIGFGLDSVIETSAAFFLIWRLSHRGSVEEEDRKEKKALYFVGITFFLLAVYILYESGEKLLLREKPSASIVGIIIAVLSITIMPIAGKLKLNLAQKIQSRALEADAVETFMCAYLSGTLLLGLGLNALFGWWWADPVAALAMVYFIVKEGWEAIEEARK